MHWSAFLGGLNGQFSKRTHYYRWRNYIVVIDRFACSCLCELPAYAGGAWALTAYAAPVRGTGSNIPATTAGLHADRIKTNPDASFASFRRHYWKKSDGIFDGISGTRPTFPNEINRYGSQSPSQFYDIGALSYGYFEIAAPGFLRFRAFVIRQISLAYSKIIRSNPTSVGKHPMMDWIRNLVRQKISDRGQVGGLSDLPSDCVSKRPGDADPQSV